MATVTRDLDGELLGPDEYTSQPPEPEVAQEAAPAVRKKVSGLRKLAYTVLGLGALGGGAKVAMNHVALSPDRAEAESVLFNSDQDQEESYRLNNARGMRVSSFDSFMKDLRRDEKLLEMLSQGITGGTFILDELRPDQRRELEEYIGDQIDRGDHGYYTLEVARRMGFRSREVREIASASPKQQYQELARRIDESQEGGATLASFD